MKFIISAFLSLEVAVVFLKQECCSLISPRNCTKYVIYMSLLELLKVMYCFIKVFLQKSAIYVLQTVLLLDAPHERLI